MLLLQWFRGRAGSITTAVLWSLVTVSAWSTAAHGGDCYDDSGAVIAAGHDAAAHRVSAESTQARPLHCLLCHWTRAFRADAVRGSRVPTSQESRAFRPIACAGSVRVVERLDLPSRAPPL